MQPELGCYVLCREKLSPDNLPDKTYLCNPFLIVLSWTLSLRCRPWAFFLQFLWLLHSLRFGWILSKGRVKAITYEDLYLNWWVGQSLNNLMFSLKWLIRSMELTLTVTWPPPGMWWAFSREPTFAWALSLKSNFTLSIRTLPPPV